MRYIRICMGGESGEPGMTLYEVDEDGWVHRQVQVHAEGTRFSPEDILMCHPVVTESMAKHPAADEIMADEFELLWTEVVDERAFLAHVPDASMPWAGRASFGDSSFELAWSPFENLGAGWTQVPGFVRLWARGDAKTARAACACVFAQRDLEWYAVRAAA